MYFILYSSLYSSIDVHVVYCSEFNKLVVEIIQAVRWTSYQFRIMAWGKKKLPFFCEMQMSEFWRGNRRSSLKRGKILLAEELDQLHDSCNHRQSLWTHHCRAVSVLWVELQVLKWGRPLFKYESMIWWKMEYVEVSGVLAN